MAGPGRIPWRRRLRHAVGSVRWVGSLDAEQRLALEHWARHQATEVHVPRTEDGIHPDAVLAATVSIRFPERVRIGARANVGPGCCIWGGWSMTEARVGAGALLGPGVVLVAGNHRVGGPEAVRELGFDEADVEVGEGAWVGAHAVIVGCRVGAGAVIGANSVVLDDVPDRAIAAGVPARVTGHRDDR